MNEQAVPLFGQSAMNADECQGGGTLQIGLGRRVKLAAQEVVRRRITYVELDGRIKRGQIHKLRFARFTCFLGRLSRTSFPA